MIASYLRAERDLGRIAVDADVDTLALTLIGTAHLLFAGPGGATPDAGAVRKVVTRRSPASCGTRSPDRRAAATRRRAVGRRR